MTDQDIVTQIGSDLRSCRLFGYLCIADCSMDFDNLPLWMLLEISDRLEIAEARVLEAPWPRLNPEAQRPGPDEINIGLYNGGKDIRVWPVFR